MSSWTKMEKTDNKITISFKRESGKPEVEMIRCDIEDLSGSSHDSDETERSSRRSSAAPAATSKRRGSSNMSIRKFTRKPRMRNIENEKMDEDVEKIIKNISHVNKAIRCKYNLPYNMRSCSIPCGATRKASEHSSDSERHNTSSSSKSSRKASKGPVDHLGVPLSHPMAVTPFPGASTAAQREKARRMLRSLAQKKVKGGGGSGDSDSVSSSKKGDKEKKKEKKTESNSASESANSSPEAPKPRPASSTTFPKKCSAETRAKARKHLIKMAKRNAGEDTSESDDELRNSRTATCSSDTNTAAADSKETTTTTTNDSETSSASSSSKKQRKWSGQLCPNCGTCTTCVHKCETEHMGNQITDSDRKKFMEGIFKLRERIQQPETDRRCASKSPFDLTQSTSENTMTATKSRRKGKLQKV